MSDIPTQIYKSADFQSATKRLCSNFADIFCRKVESEPARVEPLKLTGDEKWRIPRNGGPPHPQSTEKREETRSQIERMLELDLIEPSKLPYYSHMHLVRKPTGKWRYALTVAHKSFLPPGRSECNRCAVSLSSQCDECTHISHSFRRAEVNAIDVQCHSARSAISARTGAIPSARRK
jgi:hypothetical protein